MTTWDKRDPEKEKARLRKHSRKITQLRTEAYKWVRDNHPLDFEILRQKVGLQPTGRPPKPPMRVKRKYTHRARIFSYAEYMRGLDA